MEDLLVALILDAKVDGRIDQVLVSSSSTHLRLVLLESACGWYSQQCSTLRTTRVSCHGVSSRVADRSVRSYLCTSVLPVHVCRSVCACACVRVRVSVCRGVAGAKGTCWSFLF